MEPLKLLRIHRKTLQRMARRGEIPGVQIGKLWRFRRSELNAWMEGLIKRSHPFRLKLERRPESGGKLSARMLTQGHEQEWNYSMGAPVARARHQRDDEAPVGRYRRCQTISNGITGAAGSRLFAPDPQPVQWESRTASNQFRNPSQPLPGTRVARHVPRPCQSRMSSQQGNLGLSPGNEAANQCKS